MMMTKLAEQREWERERGGDREGDRDGDREGEEGRERGREREGEIGREVKEERELAAIDTEVAAGWAGQRRQAQEGKTERVQSE